jgi:hypothetical protein
MTLHSVLRSVATLLAIGCGQPVSKTLNVWTQAESAAVRLCQDSLRMSPSRECGAELTDGFLRASRDSAGQVRLTRYWPTNGYNIDSAFSSQQRRLEHLLGPPVVVDTGIHATWVAGPSAAVLWLHGPDTSPVDSSQRLWAVILFELPATK